MIKSTVAALAVFIALLGVGALLPAAGAPVNPSTNIEPWTAIRLDVEEASLAANDIIYDPWRDRLYASVAGGSGGVKDAVVPIFRDGRIGMPLPVGSEPNVLALSGDGQYLYVGLDAAGAVGRVNLASFTLETQWLLGGDTACGYYAAADMVVLADAPHSVAVARAGQCQPPHRGVAIYDNGVMRPDVTPDTVGSDVIEPSADAGRLFGFDRATSAGGFRTLAVTAGGVEETQVIADLLERFTSDIRYTEGRIYGTAGEVIDEASLTRLGRFAVANSSLPVVRGGRAYFLDYNRATKQYELLVFDAATYDPLAAAPISALVDTDPSQGVDFIDTGGDSAAIRVGDGTIYWLQFRVLTYASFLPVGAIR